ncbi:hypothetical protein PG985_015915 [Apiospora marii]|uniref:uncharacterized protein n=1 Tax=Apiospora marii TaxID=335849 RepID=UPI00312D4A5E
MADALGLVELDSQSSGNSCSTRYSLGYKPKKSGGIFGSMSRKIKGMRSTSTSRPANVTRSPSSSQRPLPPFSLKQFSSLKKRHGNAPVAPSDVSRKAATVRCCGTDRAVNIPRRTSVGAPVKAPRLEIPKDIGGDFMLGPVSTCSAEPVDIVFPKVYDELPAGLWKHRVSTPELPEPPGPCNTPLDTAIEPSVQPVPERSFEPLSPKPWDPMGMKGVDKQHVPSDTDHLSIFTDAAGPIDLDEDAKYWPISITSSESASHIARKANPHDFAVELEGDCTYLSLAPNFLQMAMTQLAFTRGKVEPEVRYLDRIKGILQKMTLDEFELLVEDIDRDWVPNESLWREFAQFQLRAGIMIGKRQVAATMFDRLKLEQGFHTEVSSNSVHGILAEIMEETPCFGSKLDMIFS